MYPLLHPALAANEGLETALAAEERLRTGGARQDSALCVRLATPADGLAIAALSEMDTSPAAAAALAGQARGGSVLVAERAGQLVAALSLVDGLLVSHPERHAPGARMLLRRRAAQLARGRRRALELPRALRSLRHA
jgi:hypothetical protein